MAFRVMGPGRGSQFRRRNGRGNFQTWSSYNRRTARIGEVPVYDDNVDARYYRERIQQWISYQALVSDTSDNKLNYGQQLYTIIANIHGSAEDRVQGYMSRAHKNMTEEDFCDIMDSVLQEVDPVEKGSKYIDIVNVWKELMNKKQYQNQTFDQYWTQFNSLCVKYMYYHNNQGIEIGVMENLAFMCMINSKASPEQFGILMDNALNMQEEINKSRKSLGNSKKSIATIRTTRDNLSQVSSAVESGQGQNIIETSTDQDEISQVITDLRKIMEDMSNKRDDFYFSEAELLELSEDARLKAANLQKTLEENVTKLSGIDDNLKKISEPVRSPVSLIGGRRKTEDPQISMESVRLAFKRLDKVTEVLKEGKASSNSPRSSTITTNTFTHHRDRSRKCYICQGDHFARDRPDCLEKLKKRNEERRMEKKKYTDDQDKKKEEGKSTETGITTNVHTPSNMEPWATYDCSESIITLTRTTIDISKMITETPKEIIIDGGASNTVAGLYQFTAFCDEMGVSPTIEEEKYEKWHAFGTQMNRSEQQKIIGYSRIPIPLDQGDYIWIKLMIIDGDVPIIIGKNTLQELDALEAHGRNWIQVNVFNRKVKLATKINEQDGHAYLVLSRMNILLNDVQGLLKEENNKDSSGLIRKIHARTHFHPSSVKILLKRSMKWKPEMEEIIQKVHDSCRICRETGDPEVSKKFNLSKLHKMFNNRLYMDIFYWKNSPVLHAVDYATGYSETMSLSSRKVQTITNALDRIWNNKHGNCHELFVDQEFDKGTFKLWCEDRGIKLVPIPSRRHNKTGSVERKNRVLKDILERISKDPTCHTSFINLLSKATFISNALYGNKTVSSFEMARGYTPSINGSKNIPISEHILNAWKELESRRMLSRVLKSRPLSKRDKHVNVGENVLILVPGGERKRGKWIQACVTKIREDNSIECGTGKHKKIIAREDYRTLPRNTLAKSVFMNMYEVEKGIYTKQVQSDKIEENQEDNYDDYFEDDDDDEDSSPFKNPTRVLQSSKENDIQKNSNNEQDDSDITLGEFKGTPNQEQNQEGLEHTTNIEKVTTLRRSQRTRKKPERYGMVSSEHAVKSFYGTRNVQEQDILMKLYENIGTSQFMMHEHPHIPYWIMHKARQIELRTNCQPNMQHVLASTVPKDANIIGSHFVYKIKMETTNSNKTFTLKARLCVHGNKDAEKDNIRSDAAVVSHFGLRLMYSIAVTLGMKLAKMDIKGAYTQAGDLKREIFVRPPGELRVPDTMFLLKSNFYGLVSAGRKFKLVSDELFISRLSLQNLVGVPQLFYRKQNDDLVLMLAKYVDDIVLAGLNDAWLHYAKKLIETVFEISKWNETPEQLVVNSTEVNQQASNITVTMNEYQKNILTFHFGPLRRKQIGDKSSIKEISEVRSLAGILVYMGIAISPLALLLSSIMQQTVPYLTVGVMKQMNGWLRDFIRKKKSIFFPRPNARFEQALIVVFTDAGYPHKMISDISGIVQEGCIAGIAFGEKKGSVFHPLAYHARKERRTSSSTFSAESISAVSGLGVGLMLQDILSTILGIGLEITLVVDSLSLQKSSSTDSTPRDASNMADICRFGRRMMIAK